MRKQLITLLSALSLFVFSGFASATTWKGNVSYIYVGNGYLFARLDTGRFCFAASPRTPSSVGAVLTSALIANQAVEINCTRDSTGPGNYMEVTVIK